MYKEIKRKIEIYMPEYGQVKVYDADHLPIIPGLFDASVLENCSTECLQEINRRVAETRQARSMTREEQRETLRKAADQARGYKLFRENDKTALDRQVRLKDSVMGYEFVNDGPQSTPAPGAKMDRSAGVFQSTTALINPETKTEYTRSELLSIARDQSNASRELWRKLTRLNANRVNEILDAKA